MATKTTTTTVSSSLGKQNKEKNYDSITNQPRHNRYGTKIMKATRLLKRPGDVERHGALQLHASTSTPMQKRCGVVHSSCCHHHDLHSGLV